MTAPDSARPDGLTLLFVDDEPAVVRAISRAIAAKSGFEVLTAGSAHDALEILRTRRVDVLCSDIDMPRMNGLELVRVARRDYPTTLRILLTGAGTMDRAVNAINEGEVVRFFAKPFDLPSFVRALEDLGGRILALRRERYADAQRARCAELFRWIEDHYPGTLDVQRGPNDEVLLDAARLRAFVAEAGPAERAFVGRG